MNKNQFLYGLFFLFHFSFSFSAITWESFNEGVTIKIITSDDKIEIPNKLIITLIYEAPNEYKIDKNKLRKNLLSYSGFSENPLSLFLEKEYDNKIIYELNPEIPGNFFYSFGRVFFESNNKPSISFLTPTFPIHIIINSYQYLPGEMAPLLSFSSSPIVSLNKFNQYVTFKDPAIVSLEEKKIKSRFSQKFSPMSLFMFLLSLKGIILSLFIYKVLSRRKSFNYIKDFYKDDKKEAFFELESLKKEKLAQKGEIEKYFSCLSDILKKYIKKNWKIKTSPLTAYEFLNNFTVDNPCYNEVIRFLLLSEEIKFAKRNVSKKICDEAYDIIHEFIQKN